MKLFTKAILKTLPKVGELAEVESEDIIVKMKLFDCGGGSTWYIYEYTPEEDLASAFCILNGDIQMAECGLVSIKELKDVLGWRLNRDLYFDPQPILPLIQKIKNGEHI